MDAARTPFVAAIHGFCLGGGLELAMCCDIRVASDDAQLGQPEIKLGLIPGGGGTQRLPRLVGIGRALLLNLTGDFIDAQTAYDWGLVERVVPRDELRETALGIARTIAVALARRGRDPPRARADDARPPARGGPAARGRRLPPLPRVRGRRRGRRRVPREARAELHRSLRAAVLKGVGGPEQLVVEEMPEPEAAEGQAVVDVRAAGINFADVLIRLGMYPQPPELPAVLGSEVAGEVDGARVLGFVFASGGGYAERARSTSAGSFRCPRARASPRAPRSRWPSSPPGFPSPSSRASPSGHACSSPPPRARSAPPRCRSSAR